MPELTCSLRFPATSRRVRSRRDGIRSADAGLQMYRGAVRRPRDRYSQRLWRKYTIMPTTTPSIAATASQKP